MSSTVSNQTNPTILLSEKGAVRREFPKQRIEPCEYLLRVLQVS